MKQQVSKTLKIHYGSQVRLKTEIIPKD